MFGFLLASPVKLLCSPCGYPVMLTYFWATRLLWFSCWI